MIYVIVVIWLLLGLYGYFMMYQGFMFLAHNNKRAWDLTDSIVASLAVPLGPIFMIVVFSLMGMKCFKKWRE